MLQFTFSYYFTFERKYLKIIASSKRDGLKMNGSSIGLGKKNAKCSYCSKYVNVTDMEEAALTSHMKGKKHVERSPSDGCIKSLIPPIPALLLIILKISLSGVWSLQ